MKKPNYINIIIEMIFIMVTIFVVNSSCFSPTEKMVTYVALAFITVLIWLYYELDRWEDDG